MNKKVKIGTGPVMSITDADYLAAGGEAAIYVKNNKAFKLYHDPVKKMLPTTKIQELSAINNTQVIIPENIIYNSHGGEPVGYTTRFVNGAEPLLKFFTRSFKTNNQVTPQMINELVKTMQLITMDIHRANCLIVDYNELNVLVNISSKLVPWYIDTDSYATPSHKATAIMDSVRDRRVTVYDKRGDMHYNPDIGSDWFSFAILSFWLYSNIHPFRGNHDDYKPRDKSKQMDDGISVFHPGVRVPPSVNSFSVIPKRHLDWFKDVFVNNNRELPPIPDAIAPQTVPSQIVIVKGTDKLEVIDIESYSENILSVINRMGINYVVTEKHVYSGKKEICSTDKLNKTILCAATDGSLIIAKKRGVNITFCDRFNQPIGSINGVDMFQRNSAVYTLSDGKFNENVFRTIGTGTIHQINTLEHVSKLTSTMYDGCVIQDLFGKKYLTVPYQLGAANCKHIIELDKFRVISAKADKNVVVIIAEQSGKYSRFILIFDKTFQDYKMRVVTDIAYDEINFAVMDNGLCMLLASPDEIELFVNTTNCEVISNPPFDSSMKLFTTPMGFFFINGNSIHQLKKR